MRHLILALLVLALAVTAGVSTPSSCPNTAPVTAASRTATAADFEAVDAYVRRAMDDWNVPGLAMAVVKDDSVV